MKKLLIIVICSALLALGFTTGCNKVNPAEDVTESIAAQSVATLGKYALAFDNNLLYAFWGITTLDIGAKVVYGPTYSGVWWTGSNDYTNVYMLSYNFRIWSSAGEITTLPALNNLKNTKDFSKIVSYSIWDFTPGGSNYTIYIGKSTSDPITITYKPSRTIDGPVVYDGANHTVEIDFNNHSLTSSGYPVNGSSVNVAVTSGGTTIHQGTLTFTGTGLATLALSSGTSYYIDLDEGTAELVQ